MGLAETVLAWVVAAGVVAAVIDVLHGGRRIQHMKDAPPRETGPLVSIVVAARNEERGIEAGVRSLLRSSYRPVEVVVVNDRSTDGTSAVLTRLQREHPDLVVETIDTLPAGWLGKNHALARGARRAGGTFLIFTDADVVFDASTVGRAVAVIEREQLDHLTALPAVILSGIPLTAMVTTFGVLFAVYTRPWKARDPRSRHHIGVGAFNMLRRTAYERIGTHAAIALRPDDDLRLARAVKQAGLHQDVVHAQSLLAVEWYPSVAAMVNGLMKNAFAGIDYSIAALVASTFALLTFNVWPWVVLLSGSGQTRLPAGIAVAGLSMIVVAHTRASRVSPLYALLYPFGVLGFIYILWRSAVLALATGTISWRDTAYPLDELRRARPAAPLGQP